MAYQCDVEFDDEDGIFEFSDPNSFFGTEDNMETLCENCQAPVLYIDYVESELIRRQNEDCHETVFFCCRECHSEWLHDDEERLTKDISLCLSKKNNTAEKRNE